MKFICKLIRFITRMAQQICNIGSAYKDPDADKSRDAFDKINDNFTELYAADSVFTSWISGYNFAKIEITDWNMDSTSGKSVAWALPADSYIVSINVVIEHDSNGSVYPLDYGSGVANSGGYYYDGNSFELFRASGETFDAVDFDGTAHRGWIFVIYFTDLS